MRFKNPIDGEVSWHDLVKGSITIANQELDDLIIARADGTPTYNFCVVVDDWDMQISHVLRGDDHINNTPRQINILRSLQAPIPQYGHLPMILGADGEKLSKRHGAVSVLEYREYGYLPHAMLNYLARLGWGHGDTEIFSMQELAQWFDIDHLSKSAAQFNPEKLNWLNQHYLKQADTQDLIALLKPFLAQRGIATEHGPRLENVVDLLKERVETVKGLAEQAQIFYQTPSLDRELLKTYCTPEVLSGLQHFVHSLATIDWNKESIAACLKQSLQQHQLKMPQLAMPLRIMLTGQTQSPSIDQLIYLLGKEIVINRVETSLP